jgi:hypothetical protein
MSYAQLSYRIDWCAKSRRWVTIEPGPDEPSARAIVRGRRIRRVWAELSRAQRAGETPPSCRVLAVRCGLPSSSTAYTCIEALVAMGVVDVLARADEPSADGSRRRVARAIRVAKLYGWDYYD